jgi:hypothetical protein
MRQESQDTENFGVGNANGNLKDCEPATFGGHDMDRKETVDLITDMLTAHNIHSVSQNRAWPQSLYFGRYGSDYLQIRVSDHEKKHLSRIEVNIYVGEKMSLDQVHETVNAAIEEFEDIENELAAEDGVI